MSESIIQMKEVNKWFGDFQVLKDINLEVKEKQKIKPKNETINVRDNPPHALVSTHSRPKEPPEIKKLRIINAIIG